MEGKFNIFAVLGKRMDWLSQRQTVLAENIANFDTPDYVPQDPSERDFMRILRNQLTPVDPKATPPSSACVTSRAIRPPTRAAT